jgi:hypothetical protein
MFAQAKERTLEHRIDEREWPSEDASSGRCDGAGGVIAAMAADSASGVG